MYLMQAGFCFLIPDYSFYVIGDIFSRHVNPICQTTGNVIAALDLIVTLSSACTENLQYLSELLVEMYYDGEFSELFTQQISLKDML